jgi:hypothetical protein
MIGAIATIAGTAILVYANRPDCDMNRYAGGCGYGTKVVGGSVLAGGLVGLTVGAITWMRMWQADSRSTWRRPTEPG